MHKAAASSWKALSGLGEQDARSGRLLRAFLTTFDPPDPGLLIEEYLPVWLGLENSYADEGHNRLRYFAELEDELRRLKGQIAIVSSAGEVGTSAEAWIWNYILRFEVGAKAAAVQHAKLWMFHRAPEGRGGPETLELVVSSANLTRDGLRGQIQSGWRCVLPVRTRSSNTRTAEWGVFPAFLEELGNASGGSAPKTVQHWLDLLGRCECPDDVEFIASVPGAHSAATLRRRRSAWGASGLRASWSGRAPRKIIAMAPTIGRWTSESVPGTALRDAMKEWAKHAGVEPDRISVAWVRRGHPWAARWQLDCETEKALTQSGICWLQVPHPDDHADDWKSPLCDEHQKVDQRWAHAKLYELRAGAWRRLLITSANLSRAAWGDPRDGGLVIDNFELGVLLRVQEGFGDRLRGGAFDHATCHVDYDRPIEASIAWLAAEWDGKELTVECRTTPGATLASQIDVTVARTSAKRMPVTWASGTPTGCTARWPPRDGVPVLICVRTTVGCIRRIAVRDVRPTDNGQILCGEFDEEQLREERDRLLEERYGYAPAPETRGTSPNENRRTATVANGADYAVPAYVDARRRFQLVDNWWKELQDAGDRARPFILNDGRRIRELWTAIAESGADRGIRVAARVAADELRCRIQRHEREH